MKERLRRHLPFGTYLLICERETDTNGQVYISNCVTICFSSTQKLAIWKIGTLKYSEFGSNIRCSKGSWTKFWPILQQD